MTVADVAPGLRRWTSWHDHWEEEVGSVAVDTDDGLVLIDPTAPPPELREPAHVLFTVYWHARAGAELGGRVWAPPRSVRPLRTRHVEVTDVATADTELPGGIRAFPTARAAEAVYWLPQQQAVVVGDVLLRLCAKRWLGTPTLDDLRATLRSLLELPVERVLVSHGRPVLSDGKRALEQVL